MTEASIFVFGHAPIGVHRASVPAGIVTTQHLFDVLFDQLKLPDYFGNNWNALEECIRDLSWLAPGTVVLAHADLPLRGDPDLEIYLTVLGDAVSKRRRDDERKLVVVFPADAADDIRRAL